VEVEFVDEGGDAVLDVADRDAHADGDFGIEGAGADVVDEALFGLGWPVAAAVALPVCHVPLLRPPK